MKDCKERILLGEVKIPAHAVKWMKFVTGDGKVFAQPFVRAGRKKA